MKRIVLLMLFLCLSTSAFALGDPVTDESQLLGCWKQRLYPAGLLPGLGAPDLYDPVQQKYRWFCFYPDHHFSVLTMNSDKDLSGKDLEQYTSMFPHVMSWTLLGTGVVRIEHKEDPNQNMNWLVSLAPAAINLADGVAVEKGDMYLGLINKAQDAYALLRILTKVG